MKSLRRILLAGMFALPVLFVSCGDKDTGGDTRLAAAPTSTILTRSAQTPAIMVSAPVIWSISSDKTWVKPAPSTGSAGHNMTVTLNVEANAGETSRNARLTLTSTGGTPVVVTVVQKGTGNSAGSSEVNDWIFGNLSENYLWNDAVKQTDPDYALAHDDFLENLIINLKGAKDSDGTIDGGYYDNGSRYVYSYIETDTDTRAGADEFNAPTYGFDFIPMKYESPQGLRIVCFVKWIRENSPASAAGLKRGMRIEKFNGQYLTDYVYSQFLSAYYTTSNGTALDVTPMNGTAITMTSATMELTPIIRSKMLTSPVSSKKVAYFCYDSFEIGAELSGNKYRFVEDMRSAFAGFRGADNLVLDLRYNGGGYVYCSQVLASLSANVNTSMVFNRMYDNKRNNAGYKPAVDNFLDETNSLKLGKGKIYVLVSGSTASSSELVINSLAGVGLDVVLIGETTEGKNVGMDLQKYTVDGTTYEMWPITFKSFNAAGKTSLPTGTPPDYKVADPYNYLDVTDFKDLGDPAERLLKTALDLIDGKTVPKTRAPEAAGTRFMKLENTGKRRGPDGARRLPEHMTIIPE